MWSPLSSLICASAYPSATTVVNGSQAFIVPPCTPTTVTASPITVTPTTTLFATSSPIHINLIEDGSFENQGPLVFDTRIRGTYTSWVVTGAGLLTARTGSRYLLLSVNPVPRLPRAPPSRLSQKRQTAQPVATLNLTQAYTTQPGRAYTQSAYLQAIPAGSSEAAECYVRVCGTDLDEACSGEFQPMAAQWTGYSERTTAEELLESEGAVKVQVQCDSSAYVGIDDVVVVEDGGL